MLKTIALVAAAGIAAVLAYAATRPDAFRVARSATVQAPPEKLHALIRQTEGPSPFLGKLIGVMDRMVGGQFESGLADLKQRAERT